MPRFEPFTALRYRPETLPAVTAPPYDVLSDVDRQELADRDPHNVVHIDVPLESDGPDRYRMAGEQLHNWISSGILHLDSEPSYTIYRMAFVDASGRRRSTVGVFGALEVVDEGAGGVLPHERTTPKAKTDRLDLTRATRANLSAVWGLSLAPGLSELLLAPGQDLGHVDVDGVRHSFERVTSPERIRGITECVSGADVLIADGHHRYAISRTYRDEQRLQDSGTQGRADLTMTYVQELVEEQLSVQAIHRLYTGVNYDDLVRTLGVSFHFAGDVAVNEEVTKVMDERGALVLIGPDGRGTIMVPKTEIFAGQRDLDGARLEFALRSLEHSVSYQHGVSLAFDIVTKARAVAAVLIRPVSVMEIRRTATEGLLMPPKSTFFTPKLLTGAVIRPLAELK